MQVENANIEGTKRVVILSDGHANYGITSHQGIASIAATHHSGGVSVSAIGLGLDYNENLM